jgi:ABC-2 type transport system ATP-binding protein
MPLVSAQPVVVVNDLSKRFGRRRDPITALDHVSLTVRSGEIVGLLGRNGAGKTTLVKAILGLLRPSSGSVRVYGRDPRSDEVHLHLGYSPEEPGFPRYLTVRRVLEMCGSLSGLDPAALALAVEHQLEAAELGQFAGRPVRQLSKGMAQRLSIAQALLHEPSLLILDEPTADLDPIARRQVRDLIVAFRDRGGTVLLNSHLLSEVELVCDRVAIVHQGRVHREGDLGELLSGGRQLEDVFVEVVAGAGGGAGYAARPEGRS